MLKGFLENVDEMLTDGEYRHLFSYKKSPVRDKKKGRILFLRYKSIMQWNTCKEQLLCKCEKVFFKSRNTLARST